MISAYVCPMSRLLSLFCSGFSARPGFRGRPSSAYTSGPAASFKRSARLEKPHAVGTFYEDAVALRKFILQEAFQLFLIFKLHNFRIRHGADGVCQYMAGGPERHNQIEAGSSCILPDFPRWASSVFSPSSFISAKTATWRRPFFKVRNTSMAASMEAGLAL